MRRMRPQSNEMGNLNTEEILLSALIYHGYILQPTVLVKTTAFILFGFLGKLRLSALWKIIST